MMPLPYDDDDQSRYRKKNPNSTTKKRIYNNVEYNDMKNADIIGAWLRSIPSDNTREVYTQLNKRFMTAIPKPINKITTADVREYLSTLKTWSARYNMLSAIRSLIYFALENPPNLKSQVIKIGIAPQAKPIKEPSKEEWDKLYIQLEKEPLIKQIAIRLTLETGHRRTSIVELPRNAIGMKPTGPYVNFPPENEKRKTVSVAPISQKTYDLIKQFLLTHTDEKLFPDCMLWNLRVKWFYFALIDWGKAAGINTRTNPHLFRHIKALEFRRTKAPVDLVINTLGWKNERQYNERYGRRPNFETCEEARQYLPIHEPLEQRISTPNKSRIDVVSELMDMLKNGLIDQDTFKVSIKALPHEEDNKTLGDTSQNRIPEKPTGYL